jgi:Neurotransmitter-gated ion-channel ligand binding domain
MATIQHRRRLPGIARALAPLGLLVSIALYSAGGFCADPDSQTTVDPGDEQSTAAAADKAAEKAVEKAVGKTVEQAAEKAAEKAVQKTVGKAAEKAVQKTVEKATEKAVEKAAEKAAVKAVEKATAVATLQAEQTARRPDEWKGPTRVHFLVFVIDIDDIDDADQNFKANVYIRLRWKDRRLASPGSPVRQIPLDTVWNPRVVVANLTDTLTKSLPDVVQVEPDGTVTYHQRYTGKLSQAMRLSDFPRDEHTFVVQFVATGYSADQLEFLPDIAPNNTSVRGGSIADQLSLTDWKVLGFEALSLPYKPIEAVNAAGFGIRFEASRYIEYYLWQVVLPMSVVVIMSWSAFWVGRMNVGVRIGVATSSILTMIANRFVLASLLPRLPYMTRMDYFTVGSTLLVFLALFMVVAITFLDIRQKVRMAEKLDLWSRGAFPAAFALLLGWFLFG